MYVINSIDGIHKPYSETHHSKWHYWNTKHLYSLIMKTAAGVIWQDFVKQQLSTFMSDYTFTYSASDKKPKKWQFIISDRKGCLKYAAVYLSSLDITNCIFREKVLLSATSWIYAATARSNVSHWRQWIN